MILKRYGSTPMGTFGELHIGDDMWHTVERPWLDNQPNISCIPEGVYTLEDHNSPKYGQTFALVNKDLGVCHWKPQTRCLILIHAANRSSELEGCIAPGKDLGALSGEWAVMSSRTALNEILPKLKDGDQLTVEWQR